MSRTTSPSVRIASHPNNTWPSADDPNDTELALATKRRKYKPLQALDTRLDPRLRDYVPILAPVSSSTKTKNQRRVRVTCTFEED